MPCCKVPINKSFQCDKAGCICLPTNGNSCICISENDNGDIVRCYDCKCVNSDKCKCKCDNSKCTCIETEGADCICVCRDRGGSLKVCDCNCVENGGRCCKRELVQTKELFGCCGMKFEKDARGNCKCCHNYNIQATRRVVISSKKYSCTKHECVCLPTNGKSCICICENEDGDIVQCDDCKCVNSGPCKCKCDNSICTCIETNGADCICVCKDHRGNFMVCDFSCTKINGRCCKKQFAQTECCSKKLEKEACGNCKCNANRNFQLTSCTTSCCNNSNGKLCCTIPVSSECCKKEKFVCISGGKSCSFAYEDRSCDSCKCCSKANACCKSVASGNSGCGNGNQQKKSGVKKRCCSLNDPKLSCCVENHH